jgi:hypothetical protein
LGSSELGRLNATERTQQGLRRPAHPPKIPWRLRGSATTLEPKGLRPRVEHGAASTVKGRRKAPLYSTLKGQYSPTDVYPRTLPPAGAVFKDTVFKNIVFKNTVLKNTARRTPFWSDRSLRTLLSVDQGSKVLFASLPGAYDRISCRHRTLPLGTLPFGNLSFALCHCSLLITVTHDAHAASRRAVYGLSCPASLEVAGTQLHSQRWHCQRFHCQRLHSMMLHSR